MELISFNNINDIIMTSRIRLARNISGCPLPCNMDAAWAREIEAQLKSATQSDYGFQHIRMAGLSPLIAQSLVEKHLISPHLIGSKFGSVFVGKKCLCTDKRELYPLDRDFSLKSKNNSQGGGALTYESMPSINIGNFSVDTESLSIMVNEEDHIREQCILAGLSLMPAFTALNKLDKIIILKLRIAFSDDYGFLTSCFTNAGTGMRASAMVFLPALCITGEIDAVTDSLNASGVTIRGTYGEGTRATSFLFQVSNRYTIGSDEESIIEAVRKSVEDIAYKEAKARKKVELNRDARTPVYMSMATLKSGLPLGIGDFITHFCNVKLGISLGYFAVSDLNAFNGLIDSLQEATLIADRGIVPERYIADRERGEIAKEVIQTLFAE